MTEIKLQQANVTELT